MSSRVSNSELKEISAIERDAEESVGPIDQEVFNLLGTRSPGINDFNESESNFVPGE